MSLNETSIWISIFALGISTLTFYFTLFHKKHNLVATLAKWTNDEDPKNLENICEIGIFNNGNRDLLIQSIQIDLSEHIPNQLYPELELNEIPCALKIGESKLVALPIPKLFMRTAQAANRNLKLEIYVYTIDGELRIATKLLVPIVGDIKPSPLDWTPFSLRKSKSERQTVNITSIDANGFKNIDDDEIPF